MSDPSTGAPRQSASEINIQAGLERLGHRTFRMGQQQAVETLLAEDRLLLVAPTGGGKSLVYQLPAVVLPGTALVISPLISLMTDQVEALEQRGIAATFPQDSPNAAAPYDLSPSHIGPPSPLRWITGPS